MQVVLELSRMWEKRIPGRRQGVDKDPQGRKELDFFFFPLEIGRLMKLGFTELRGE